jgi:hypothetical protein
MPDAGSAISAAGNFAGAASAAYGDVLRNVQAIRDAAQQQADRAQLEREKAFNVGQKMRDEGWQTEDIAQAGKPTYNPLQKGGPAQQLPPVSARTLPANLIGKPVDTQTDPWGRKWYRLKDYESQKPLTSEQTQTQLAQALNRGYQQAGPEGNVSQLAGVPRYLDTSAAAPTAPAAVSAGQSIQQGATLANALGGQPAGVTMAQPGDSADQWPRAATTQYAQGVPQPGGEAVATRGAIVPTGRTGIYAAPPPDWERLQIGPGGPTVYKPREAEEAQTAQYVAAAKTGAEAKARVEAEAAAKPQDLYTLPPSVTNRMEDDNGLPRGTFQGLPIPHREIPAFLHQVLTHQSPIIGRGTDRQGNATVWAMQPNPRAPGGVTKLWEYTMPGVGRAAKEPGEKTGATPAQRNAIEGRKLRGFQAADRAYQRALKDIDKQGYNPKTNAKEYSDAMDAAREQHREAWQQAQDAYEKELDQFGYPVTHVDFANQAAGQPAAPAQPQPQRAQPAAKGRPGPGGGRKLTDPEAREYFRRAGGDADKARELARKDGRTF